MTRLAAPALLTVAAAALVLGSDGSWSVAKRVAGRPAARGPRAPRGEPSRGLVALSSVVPAGVGFLRRFRVRFQRDRILGQLPLALDLLACALRAGQPPSMAADAVAGAVGGPVGDALLAVARAADLGAPPDTAWQPLERLTSVAAVARIVAGTTESGTRLADELAQIATDLRARQAAATDARVRRAGVLVVLPLGLCFLPAFALIGVVPIVIGVAGSVLR